VITRMHLTFALGLLAVGCVPDLTRLEIIADTDPPLEHSASQAGVTMTEGNAMAVTIRAFNEEDELEDGRMTLYADAGMTVMTRVYDLDEGTSQFVLIADAAGSGNLTAFVEGTSGELKVPFTIAAQE
jgi:hypothetical protein